MQASVVFAPLYRPSIPWALVLGGVGVSIAGFLIVRRTHVLQILLFGVLLLFGGVGFSLSALAQYAKLRRALESGTLSIAEGTLNDLHREPADSRDHRPQSFTVAGTRFEQSSANFDGGMQPGSTSSAGLREGLRVRVWYVPSNNYYSTIVAIDSASR